MSPLLVASDPSVRSKARSPVRSFLWLVTKGSPKSPKLNSDWNKRGAAWSTSCICITQVLAGRNVRYSKYCKRHPVSTKNRPSFGTLDIQIEVLHCLLLFRCRCRILVALVLALRALSCHGPLRHLLCWVNSKAAKRLRLKLGVLQYWQQRRGYSFGEAWLHLVSESKWLLGVHWFEASLQAKLIQSFQQFKKSFAQAPLKL